MITLCYKFKNMLYKYLGIAHKYINNYFIYHKTSLSGMAVYVICLEILLEQH